MVPISAALENAIKKKSSNGLVFFHRLILKQMQFESH